MVLQIQEPIIAHIPESTNFLSVVQSNVNFDNWLLDNYIDIIIHKDYFKLNSETFYNRNNSCFCDEIILKRQFVNAVESDIIDFTRCCIDSSTYITLPVNRYHIPAYSQYKNFHSTHPMFIYGYEDSCETVYIADFFRGFYTKAKCTYNDLRKAFYDVEKVKGDLSVFKYADIRDQEVQRITLYSLNEDVELKISLATFKKNIEHYLDRTYPGITMPIKDFSMLTTDDYAFNLNYYKVLRSYLVDNFKANRFVFPRPFYLLKAKCTLMLYRLENILNQFMDENILHKIIHLFKELDSLCTVTINYVIKVNLTKDEGLIEQIIGLLSKIEIMDERVMRSLLKVISNCSWINNTHDIRRFVRK